MNRAGAFLISGGIRPELTGLLSIVIYLAAVTLLL
jgi:hypothetical protein